MLRTSVTVRVRLKVIAGIMINDGGFYFSNFVSTVRLHRRSPFNTDNVLYIYNIAHTSVQCTLYSVQCTLYANDTTHNILL